MTTRRDELSKALDLAIGAKTYTGNRGDVVRQVLKTEHSRLPGHTSKALNILTPDERVHVLHQAGLMREQRELGRHGLSDREVARQLGADHVVLARVTDGLETDTLARDLMKRMGTDANLEPPPITNRDLTAAAYDAAQAEDYSRDA